MIDLNKERKAFEKMWIEIGGNTINFTFDKNMYVWSSQEPKDKTETILIDLATRSINGAWAVFLTKEREKQSEIDELKAKLAKFESEQHKQASIYQFEINHLAEANEKWKEVKKQVPEGFILMPMVPSQAMVDAVRKCYEGESYLPYSLYSEFVNQAIIEAAQENKE